MSNNEIHTDNTSFKNIIEINNNNAKYYEELAKSFMKESQRYASDCAGYLSLIQRIKNACELIEQRIDRDITGDIYEHMDNVDNPHYVTAEQVGAYAIEDMSTVATSGDYNDLINKPTIPTVPTNISSFTNDSGYITTSALSDYVQSSSLASVATSGSYNDLSNKPTIPAAQVNPDWNANSGISQILNKPSLATVATSGSYNDLSNKPTIPTVNNATLTIQKNGVDVQTFTANASSNATANITVPTNTNELTNGAGFLTGINSSMVTTALGYTPYNSTNPSGYVTSSVQTLQPITTTTGTLSLVDGTSMYKLTPSGATTLSFTNGTTASGTKAYTFELCIDMSTVYTITFPTVTWQGGETPDLSSTGIYFLAFRTIDGGTTWLGNLQGVW